MDNKTLCFICEWRQQLVGDRHSSCVHPECAKLGSLFGLKKRMQLIEEFGIKLNPHGVRNNWANWPYNFDPIWVLSCGRFTDSTKLAGG